jgi:Tfp pilus assembly protein PilV
MRRAWRANKKHKRHRLRSRRAFTIVELLVAVLLIDIGLLALVAAGALVVRRIAEGHAQAFAVRTTMNRIESIASTLPCVALRGQMNAPHGVHEAWAVSILPGGDREIIDSVRYQEPSGPRTIVNRSRTAC